MIFTIVILIFNRKKVIRRAVDFSGFKRREEFGFLLKINGILRIKYINVINF